VLRSTWPNIPAQELAELCGRWAARQSCHAVVVFDGSAPTVDPSGAPIELVSSGGESADDWIAREAAELRRAEQPFWLVTSDRELRARAGQAAERVIGGGTFARTLLELRT